MGFSINILYFIILYNTMPYDTPYNRKLAEQIKNINERYLAHCREEVMRPFITGAGAVEEEIDEPENYDIIEVTAKPRKQDRKSTRLNSSH